MEAKMPDNPSTSTKPETKLPKRRATASPAPFTNGQQAILQLLNRPLTARQLNDIQQLIQQYLASQTDALAEQAWQQKGYTQADMDRLLTTHVRTPYKKQ
jgi:type IV pilus biogenesis protein CpaD/CtpE